MKCNKLKQTPPFFFSAIIVHLRQDLEADNTASFVFLDGLFASEGSKVIEYGCPPPNLNWFDLPKETDRDEEVLANCRQIKDEYTSGKVTAEEAMRAVQIYARDMFMPSPSPSPHAALDDDTSSAEAAATELGKDICMAYIRNFIQEEGPFHGVIGTSQGATVAAMVLLDDLDKSSRWRKDEDNDSISSSSSMFECGVFFVGFPPISLDKSGYVLSDESPPNTKITIPTCHVVGEEDIWHFGALALINVCDPNSTTVVTHKKGHVVPHTVEAMVGVAKFIREISRRRRAAPTGGC